MHTFISLLNAGLLSVIRCGDEAWLGLSLWCPLSMTGEGLLGERGQAGGRGGARVLHARLRNGDSVHFAFICLCAVALKPLLSLCYIQQSDSSASTNYLAKVFLGEIISHKHLLSSLLYVPPGTGALDINHLVPSPSTHLSQRTP